MNWGDLKISDIANVIGVGIGLLGAFVAIVSMFVAVAQLRQAIEDGKEQKASLETSRKQLETVAESIKDQQVVLSKNLETSKSLLAIQSEQQKVLTDSLSVSRSLLALQKEERERVQELANRKPKILAMLGSVFLENSKIETTLTVEKETNQALLPLGIRNVGSAPLHKPIYTARAKNREVTIWLEGSYSDAKDKFRTEISGLTVNDILPFDRSGANYNSGIHIMAPQTVSEVDLTFSLTGENLEKSFVIEFHIHLNRP